MTRVESMVSQILELTPAQRDELGEMLDRKSYTTNDSQLTSILLQVREWTRDERIRMGELLDERLGDDEFDHTLTEEQMAEVYRRLDDLEAGRAKMIDEDEFFRRLDASLEERRRQA